MASNAIAYSVHPGTDKVNKKILLVDDEPGNRLIFRDMLSELGYDVIEQADGASALSAIRNKGRIDLVISDYRMPGMNGLEFVEQVREFLPALPVIMITDYASVETYIRSRGLHVFEYINKPVKKHELDVIIKAALNNADDRQN